MWVVWKTFDQQMEATFAQFEKWGVKGIKVDFMQRDDQWMVNFYERVAREAAKRRMLVDFHGAYKPTGLYRTYPNVLTSEGIVGLEHNKWSTDASPDHNVTFPFMRMMAGPVDYTPGGMLNATKADFKPVFNRPMTQGTRCHQLAMYVVYESPADVGGRAVELSPRAGEPRRSSRPSRPSGMRPAFSAPQWASRSLSPAGTDGTGGWAP